ncbi:MAG TPA: acetyl-CoA hydrolase, partial [Desulfotomaculum sp.]|nr:acetyl-CoA hydrolase [Desulfotomaculum sp.]
MERGINSWVEEYKKKCAQLNYIFGKIHRGDRIFIGTGCGEPRFLVHSLADYVKSYPKAFFDAEVLHVWTIDIAPYTQGEFKSNFRHNSLFIGAKTREAVNTGAADYTPVFLSKIPDLFYRRVVPLDVALIQTSPPDSHGYLSLGVSVDIVKAAVENSRLVIAQVNKNMPRVHGDGFIHINKVDFIVPFDEPILEYRSEVESGVAQKIGNNVARLVRNGDTIQVGYGNIPNAILANLVDKKNLGVHTGLLSDGIVELIKKGVVDNSKKTINRGKTIASFCMASSETYEFINDNPSIEFRTIDYTNNPLIIARHENMTAINAALEIDLTGQATAESLGKVFYSGIGGQIDFMRGAVMARNGKTILAVKSTALNGEVSRIVPFLGEGAGVTLHRGDVNYVVTEFGIAYLHGKNIRERAMSLISIAHPKFRPWLIEEAKKMNLIYQDQAFIPGEKGVYQEELETFRTTQKGVEVFLRPVRINDEPLLKDFFYSLSDNSMYKRFISMRKDMPHERLQQFSVIDHTKEMIILAVIQEDEKEKLLGFGQYEIDEIMHTAEAAFVVRDDYQNKGLGTTLLSYLIQLARKGGLLSLSAEVLEENKPMLWVFEKAGFKIESTEAGIYDLKL